MMSAGQAKPEVCRDFLKVCRRHGPATDAPFRPFDVSRAFVRICHPRASRRQRRGFALFFAPLPQGHSPESGDRWLETMSSLVPHSSCRGRASETTADTRTVARTGLSPSRRCVRFPVISNTVSRSSSPHASQRPKRFSFNRTSPTTVNSTQQWKTNDRPLFLQMKRARAQAPRVS